jgi:hypothetical protein
MSILHELFPDKTLTAGVLVLSALGALALVTTFYIIQQCVILPRLRNELHDLNARRAQRVQAALAAATSPQWAGPLEHLPYPFIGWLDLVSEDGSVKVAGQVFPQGTAFEVVARDENGIPRVAAKTIGRGEVNIESHGQRYLARYVGGQWQIQELDV